MEHTGQVTRRILTPNSPIRHPRNGHQHHRITTPLTQGRRSVRVGVDGEANSSSIMGSQVSMDIHLHTGKGAIPLNKVLKGIITPTASKVLTVDLSKCNMLIKTSLFEAAMQVIVEITLKIRTADSLARGPLLQTRTMLLLLPGGEGDTSKTFSGLQAMQALKVGVMVLTISNPLQGICRPLLIHNQPQVNRAMTTIHFDLRKTYRLRIRAKRTQRCHRLRDRNRNLRPNRSPSSALLSKLNL